VSGGGVRASEIAAGLWRWTAPHPDWRPVAQPGSAAYWERDVGSVLYEGPEAAVFFDPLLPADAEPFWEWADARTADRPVAVLTTLKWHRRSRAAFVERYGASTSRARGSLPAGVESFVARGMGETMFWLPEHRALIPGDRLLGGLSGGLRVCPASWMTYLGAKLGTGELKASLRPLLDFPVQRVLVSHGEPVLRGGRDALAAALA
jgi:hypothetical protein